MVEGIYYYGEQLRWNLGWPNPNVAGAFLASLLPIVWLAERMASTFKRSPWLVLSLLLAGELVLWFLLSKTYSRGALVAALAGGAVFFTLLQLHDKNSSQRKKLFMCRGIRLIGIAVILWMTGFLGRIEPNYVSGDASATNRLVLWTGGMKMMAAAPLTGWGIGNSGEAFMQWYQPVDADAQYAGMVNSFLHVGVERGLGFLGLVLFISLLLITLGVISLCRYLRARAPNRATICAACIAVCIGFLACNFFSTLWVVRGLWWVPLAAAVSIVTLFIAKPSRGTAIELSLGLLVSLLGATACVLILYAVGSSLNSEIAVTRERDGIVLSNSKNTSGTFRTIAAFPDQEILGEDYGKELRRLMLALKPAPWRMLVAPERPLQDDPMDVCLFFGESMEREMPTLPINPGDVFVIHPTTRSDAVDLADQNVTLILPEFDFFGQGTPWKRLANEQDWPVLISQGAASDIRTAWPDVILPSMASTN